jgi:hypothetical protein
MLNVFFWTEHSKGGHPCCPNVKTKGKQFDVFHKPCPETQQY